MWFNDEKLTDSAITSYRQSLLNSCPNHVVIDNLFNATKLDGVLQVLQQAENWQTQKHTYSALYVDNDQWQQTHKDQRFVQRDVWRRDLINENHVQTTAIKTGEAQEFLAFLRGNEFMSVLSRIFNVQLTDLNVAEPDINTNYFRLSATDFVEQHADDSPGREVCLLLYLNKEWNEHAGGELSFAGNKKQKVTISPLYNRCVLFNPSSKGSEHWVEKLTVNSTSQYRYNVTSWYWSQ